MSFEELARHPTPMGELALRRRLEPAVGEIVTEVKLGDEYLMSSLFTVAEVELARLGLAEVAGDELDVLVGGLGLGYTACAVLDDPRVRSLTVVEALDEVIAWHRDGLLPATQGLATDPRTRLVHGDFFALAAEPHGLEHTAGGRIDVVLVDIDHSPRHLLDPSHGWFYTPDGMRALAASLSDSGVFALWSDDPPDPGFEAVLVDAFDGTWTQEVAFRNPLTGGTSSNTVYVAKATRVA